MMAVNGADMILTAVCAVDVDEDCVVVDLHLCDRNSNDMRNYVCRSSLRRKRNSSEMDTDTTSMIAANILRSEMASEMMGDTNSVIASEAYGVESGTCKDVVTCGDGVGNSCSSGSINSDSKGGCSSSSNIGGTVSNKNSGGGYNNCGTISRTSSTTSVCLCSDCDNLGVVANDGDSGCYVDEEKNDSNNDNDDSGNKSDDMNGDDKFMLCDSKKTKSEQSGCYYYCAAKGQAQSTLNTTTHSPSFPFSWLSKGNNPASDNDVFLDPPDHSEYEECLGRGCWNFFVATAKWLSMKLGTTSPPPAAATTTTTTTTLTTTTSSKKPRSRGIFGSLLCCFRNASSSNNNNNNAQTNCQSISAEDNGNPRSGDKYLLPNVRHIDMNKKCVVIDLDETLVHSSFKPINNADFIVPVEIDGTVHQVYVLKRPYVDEFLQRMGEMFECILFTASLAKYADPVADLLDKWDAFRCRLFREHCVFHRGNYVKDLSRLGRDLNQVVIIDNSPASYIFHPDNAVAVTSWFDEMHDTELLDLIPFFERLAHSDNVYVALRTLNESPSPMATPPS